MKAPASPFVGSLVLVCRKCTREAAYCGTKPEAAAAARLAGWLMLAVGQYLCPRCPSGERFTPNSNVVRREDTPCQTNPPPS